MFLRQEGGIDVGQRCRINVPVGVLVLEKADERLRLRIVCRAVQGHAVLLYGPGKQLLRLQDAVRRGGFGLLHARGAELRVDGLLFPKRLPRKVHSNDERQHGGNGQPALFCFCHWDPPFIVRAVCTAFCAF